MAASSAYHLISKEAENRSLGTITFLDRYVRINNPNWKGSGIILILCKYYIVISDTRYTNKFLDFFFLLLAAILSELHENSIRKDWVTKKYMEEFVWGTSLFWLYALLLLSFFLQKMVGGGAGAEAGAPCPQCLQPCNVYKESE